MAKIYVDEDGNQVAPGKLRKKPGHKTNKSTQDKKDTILNYLSKGLSAAQACRDLGVHENTISYYRKSDVQFRTDMDRLKLMKTTDGAAKARDEMPDFPTFCQEYLDTTLFNHQLQWYDILEGR